MTSATARKPELAAETVRSEAARPKAQQAPPSNIRRLRLYVRRHMKLSAVAVLEGRVVATEVMNVSQGGAGLRIDADVEAGERLGLMLPDGRKLNSTVRWARLGMCGVEFDSLLPYDDILLGDVGPSWTGPATADAAPTQSKQPAGRTERNFGIAKRLRSKRLHKAIRRAVRMIPNLIAVERVKRRIRIEQRLIARAFRKQGFSWLLDGDL